MAPPRRRWWLPIVAPAAWLVAVVSALALQLFVCASGTDAAVTPVRLVIAIVGSVAFVVGALVAVGVRRDEAWTSVARTVGAVATAAAVGSLLLVLVALIVPTASIC
jgi:hypothetical protein